MRQGTQIEEILHPAVCHAKAHDCFQLFGHHRSTRVNAQARRGQIIEQSWINRLLRPRRNRIAVAHVELDRAARIAQPAHQPHAQAAIAGIFTDFLDGYRSGVENHAIVHGDPADFTARCSQHLNIHRPKAEKVRVALRPMGHVEPQAEQHRSLQPVGLPCRYQRQAIMTATIHRTPATLKPPFDLQQCY